MKKLIVTRANDNIKEMCNLTHPILMSYASKCNAEFKILYKNKGMHPHYRILQLYDLFNSYDRILVLDSDMLILDSCPDLFKLVPLDQIGTIYEDKGSRQEDRRNRIKLIQNQRGNIDWTKGYINTGCIIFSKMHRDIFNVKKENLWMNLGFDDVLLGYNINKLKYKIKELSYKFNHMSMFSEEWNNYASVADSYIIHYAGQGRYITIERTKQIEQDLFLFKKYGFI